jgi:hypothetical protein
MIASAVDVSDGASCSTRPVRTFADAHHVTATCTAPTARRAFIVTSSSSTTVARAAFRELLLLLLLL